MAVELDRPPLISVVVPTYQRPDLLRELLQGLLEQDFRDFEVLVIDDAGQPPASVPADARFLALRQDVNRGVAAARNRGLAAARGEYVMFFDDDDTVEASYLAHVAAAVKRGHVLMTGVEPSRLERFTGRVQDVLLNQMTPHLGRLAVPRDGCPRFDELFLATQDVEWLLRVSHIFPFKPVSSSGYHVRKHQGVRHGNGTAARVHFSALLMQEHRHYFRSHPRASAFRYLRMSLMSYQLQDFRAARRYAVLSLRQAPSSRALWHVLLQECAALRRR